MYNIKNNRLNKRVMTIIMLILLTLISVVIYFSWDHLKKDYNIISIEKKAVSKNISVSFESPKVISNNIYSLNYKINKKDKKTYYSRISFYVNSKKKEYQRCQKVNSGKTKTLKIEVPSNSKYNFMVEVYEDSSCNNNKVFYEKSKTYTSKEIYPQFENNNYLNIPLNIPKFYKGVTSAGKERFVFDYYGVTTYYYKSINKKYLKGETKTNKSKCKKLAPTNNYSKLIFELSVDNKVLKNEITINLYKDSNCTNPVKELKNGTSTNYSNTFTYLYDSELPKITKACRETNNVMLIEATDDSMIVGFQLRKKKNEVSSETTFNSYQMNKSFNLRGTNVSRDFKYLVVYDSVGNEVIKKVENCRKDNK